MKFKSEICYKFLIVITVIFLILCILPFIDNTPLKGIAIVVGILLSTVIFIWYLFYSVVYTIEGSYLNIKCGFLYNKQILISSIKAITKTSSLLSSPAASLTERIELKFGKYDSVIISPKNRLAFVKALQEINPDIEDKL